MSDFHSSHQSLETGLLTPLNWRFQACLLVALLFSNVGIGASAESAGRSLNQVDKSVQIAIGPQASKIQANNTPVSKSTLVRQSTPVSKSAPAGSQAERKRLATEQHDKAFAVVSNRQAAKGALEGAISNALAARN